MKRIYGHAALVAGLLFMLSVAPSWGGGLPASNDNSDGSANTGGGTDALFSNTTGGDNTAYGFAALFSNTTGGNNTAVGVNALVSNTTGGNNTAVGVDALASNTTGGDNTAVGIGALFSDTTGIRNTAIGVGVLENNTTGIENTAIGMKALVDNTTGSGNTAIGRQALDLNMTGNDNTALGTNALENSTGSGNIAVGKDSGSDLTGGDNNIYLGSFGPPAPGSESDTLRLGSTQSRAFITGVYGTIVARAATVRIDANGQLGTKSSSARYKRDIEAMGAQSQKLLQLRPVTFRYTVDPEGTRQYGLIAEEVATVYPELVTHTATGKVEGVDYEALIPMLLNELQHQQQELAVLKAHQASLEAALAQMREQRAQSVAGATHTVALAER